MSAKPGLLLDTNVWLDYLFPDHASFRSAFELIDASICAGAQLFIPATSLKDVFFVAEQTLKRDLQTNSKAVRREIAGAMVDTVRELATVVPLDTSDVWIARKEYRFLPDFEDALVFAAALRSKADYLVTSDREFIANSKVATITPERCLALLRDEGSM